MSRTLGGLIVAAALLVLPQVASAARPAPCPDLLPGGACPADVGAAVAACCHCNAFSNHGHYVRCAAHATNELRKAGCLDSDARRSLKRCAVATPAGSPTATPTPLPTATPSPDPAESELGVCYEQLDCEPLPYATNMNRAFCCRLGGRKTWCPAAAIDPVTGLCTHCVHPCQGCGNGTREGTEECDDGNAVGDDGCSATCMVE